MTQGWNRDGKWKVAAVSNCGTDVVEVWADCPDPSRAALDRLFAGKGFPSLIEYRIEIEAPDPVPVEWLRDLFDWANITTGEASRIAHVERRTVSNWVSGKFRIPWSAAELLRRDLARQGRIPGPRRRRGAWGEGD